MTVSSPYSIRFTAKQRAYIKAEAAAMKVSEAKWIKHRLFTDTSLSTAQQKALMPQSHSQDIAKILHLLGCSRIPNNLNQIAKAINTGNLILSPDTNAQIHEAYDAVMWMRRSLITAQGLKPQ